MIVHRSSGEDGRVIYAEITEKGKTKMAAILPHHYKAIVETLGGRSPAKKGEAIELLKNIFMQRLLDLREDEDHDKTIFRNRKK